MTSKQNLKFKNQEGVTLLLTLMIMAALSAIVFSISAIALNEVHTANNESGSEPAITAAEGMAEEQLFQNVRGINTQCAVSGSENYSSSGTTAGYSTSYYYNGAYNFSVASASEQDFYLYNPCSQGATPGYTSATIKLQAGAGANATVDLCNWGNNNCSGNPDISSVILTPGGSITFSSSQISANTQYVIAVVFGTAATAGNFSIATTSSDPGITGIPATEFTITTTGSKDGTTRKLQTQVPE